MERLAIARISVRAGRSGLAARASLAAALLAGCPAPSGQVTGADAAVASPPPSALAPVASAKPPDGPVAAAASAAVPAPASSTGSPSAASAPAAPGPQCVPGCANPAAAYAKLFPGQHGCTKPSFTFADLLAAGVSAGELGCVYRGVIAGCCLRTPADVAAEKLASWPTASVETRKAQALAWAREISFPFQTVLDAPTQDFSFTHHDFAPPLAVALPNGGIAVSVWLHERPGARKREVYTAQQIRFTPSGSIERVAQIAEWMR